MSGFKISSPQAKSTKQGESSSEQRHLTLMKNGQRYLFSYVPGDEAKLLKSITEMAKNADSDITMFDAAVLSHQMGRQLGNQLKQFLK